MLLINSVIRIRCVRSKT